MNDGSRGGLWLGIGAYTLWGLLPLYIRLLHGVSPIELVAHRVIWSLVLLAAVVVVSRRIATVRAAARGRTLVLLATTAALIAGNWLVYMWAVIHAQVLAASLGYFINPLVNVALALVFLGERVSRVQVAALAIATAGVLVMALSGGASLWISLFLAASFGLYGLLRKVAAIDALGGLTVETMILAPFCLVALAMIGRDGAFGHDRGLDALIMLSGLVTTMPLLMFAAAARRLRYTTMGLLQYIAPTLQFAQAVLVFGEPLRLQHLVTFGLIWAGCALYAWDNLRRAHA